MERNSSCDVLIVGTGISGLVAAQRLVAAGLSVVLLDKGYKPGGRAATRIRDERRWDHGAQYFTARTETFQALVADWSTQGLVTTWCHGFEDGEGKHPRYAVPGGMYKLPAALAEGLSVYQKTRVIKLRAEGEGWSVEAEDGASWQCRQLLLTAPGPQIQALLDESQIEPDAAFQTALAGLTYDPCFAVLGISPGPTQIPTPGGLKAESGPIAWIADNVEKGVLDAPRTVTIHTNMSYSQANLETARDAIGKQVCEAAAPWLPGGLEDVQVHRWLYSQPSCAPRAPEDAFLLMRTPMPLFVAGDALGGPKIEGAALSGIAAADAMLARVG